jgi:hypothetical protein
VESRKVQDYIVKRYSLGEEMLLELIQCHLARQSCLPYSSRRYRHDRSQGPLSVCRYQRQQGSMSQPGLANRCAPARTCARARKRAATAGHRARLTATSSADGEGERLLTQHCCRKIGDNAITFIDLEPKSSMVSLDECDNPG